MTTPGRRCSPRSSCRGDARAGSRPATALPGARRRTCRSRRSWNARPLDLLDGRRARRDRPAARDGPAVPEAGPDVLPRRYIAVRVPAPRPADRGRHRRGSPPRGVGDPAGGVRPGDGRLPAVPAPDGDAGQRPWDGITVLDADKPALDRRGARRRLVRRAVRATRRPSRRGTRHGSSTGSRCAAVDRR